MSIAINKELKTTYIFVYITAMFVMIIVIDALITFSVSLCHAIPIV